jgi:hypothetical protein
MVTLTTLAAAASLSGAPATPPEPFPHRTVPGSPRALTAARAAASTESFTTADGQRIAIEVSSRLPDPGALARSYGSFLESLPHGTELGRLRLTILPTDEIPAACGANRDDGVVACYAPGLSRMVVPGGSGPRGGYSSEYVVAHEYGHHIATYRDNSPFEAIAYGPKRWSSYERVCIGALRGNYAPGDEAGSYLQNPGENWAEAYARLTFPGQPWRFEPTLEPDDGALAAARADVDDPWARNRTQTFRGRLDSGGSSRQRHTFPLRLDGRLTARLRGPSSANYDLRLISNGEVQRRSRSRGSRDRVKFSAACRTSDVEHVTVEVVRRSGSGPYRASVSYPG